MWTKELFMSVCSNACPNLFFLGMEDQFYTYNMFAAKSWWVRDVIMGRIDRNAPLKDSAGKEWTDSDFVSLFDNLTTDRSCYELQGKVTECWMVVTGYAKADVDAGKFIDGINKAFDDWEDLKHKDIMTYRNFAHASLVTNNMSPVPAANKDWLSNKWEDDIDFYKNLHK